MNYRKSWNWNSGYIVGTKTQKKTKSGPVLSLKKFCVSFFPINSALKYQLFDIRLSPVKAKPSSNNNDSNFKHLHIWFIRIDTLTMCLCIFIEHCCVSTSIEENARKNYTCLLGLVVAFFGSNLMDYLIFIKIEFVIA